MHILNIDIFYAKALKICAYIFQGIFEVVLRLILFWKIKDYYGFKRQHIQSKTDLNGNIPQNIKRSKTRPHSA